MLMPGQQTKVEKLSRIALVRSVCQVSRVKRAIASSVEKNGSGEGISKHRIWGNNSFQQNETPTNSQCAHTVILLIKAPLLNNYNRGCRV